MKNKIIVLMSILLLAGGTWILTSCKKSSESNRNQAQTAKKAKYHCPMHPTYVSDKPGDCPICNMRLEPIESEAQTSESMRSEGGEESPIPVQGQASIKISPEREQLIGVKTDVVTYRNLKKVIRASARIAYDTELYNAIVEHKEAMIAKEKAKESPWPDVQERANALVRASALKIRQLGLSETQIENLNNDYHNPTSLLLGEKGGSVWVYAQIYEFEVGLVQSGQTMEIISPALPGKKFSGIVKSVDPILNSESRSLRVRAEVSNPDGLLKPEMYVDAKIYVDLGWRLSVPEEAALNTGERQVIFVAQEEGKYEPREVRLGREAEGYYEVISGVSKGEKVVTSANFLIDSESKLKAAISGISDKHRVREEKRSGHQH